MERVTRRLPTETPADANQPACTGRLLFHTFRAAGVSSIACTTWLPLFIAPADSTGDRGCVP
jgi:hypothetical protein